MEPVALARTSHAVPADVAAPHAASLVRDSVLTISGDIDVCGAITAAAVRASLAELAGRDAIDVTIDSLGGHLMEGLAIYLVLRESRVPVHVHIERAGSIASIIALAGATVTIATGAAFIIHDPHVTRLVRYAAADLRYLAASLERDKAMLLDIYQRRTGRSRDELSVWMTTEAEFHGAAAVEAGFADRVVPDRHGHVCPRCGVSGKPISIEEI